MGCEILYLFWEGMDPFAKRAIGRLFVACPTCEVKRGPEGIQSVP